MNVDCFKPRVVRVMRAALLAAGLLGAAAPNLAFDPLRPESMVPATPSGDLFGEGAAVCSFGELPEPAPIDRIPQFFDRIPQFV